nr:response regulator [uncultured Rhodoferax sp.]
MNRSLESHQLLLGRFYRAILIMCLAFLLVGVPFFFVRKQAAVVILLLVALYTWHCWSLSNSGRTQASLKRFAFLVWWIVVPMLYLGQSAAFMGLLLSVSVLLAVVVSTRAGVLYGISYLSASLFYLVLVHFNMEPPAYFVGTPVVQWFINAVVFWITLLPITLLIQNLQGSIENVEKQVAQRALVEEELQKAVQSANAATVAKSQFLANMSHELRTPMNAIIGMLKLLQNTELTAQQKDYAQKSDGAAHSLLRLLNDILDFSKVEAQKLTLEHVPFRVDQVLRNLSVIFSSNVGSKQVEVLFDIDSGIPPVLLGDPLRLQQVLINLGGNAIKFTERGQVVLAIKVLHATSDRVTLDFAMRDSGIGISPENQKHLFSAFSQAESSTTRRFGGTGLGLSIGKRLVELMGGTIRLTSAPGEGSTFGFTLDFPVVAAIPEDLALPQKRALPAMRALVVDDNPIARALHAGMVQSWGWPVDQATGGAQAVALVEQKLRAEPPVFPYAVIYLDWQMPDLDGWQTARKLRAMAQSLHGQELRIIMVTSNGHEALAQRSRAEQESINGFLVKPITAHMLFDATLDACQGKSAIHRMVKGRSSQRRLQGMRILVVEDNLINQQVADGLLSAEGAIVSLAANGQLGVEAVAAAAPQFDAVLMDIQMPVLDGYAATQAIRNELGLAELPIIAMTANAMASDRDACLSAGMNEHIGKPFDIGHLVSLLLKITGIEITPEPANGAPIASTASVSQLDIAIPGLDLETALARMSGMRSLYIRSARDFLSALDTVATDLQALAASNDKKKCQMFLHTLKGNAATFGATELAKEAAHLEKISIASESQTQLADIASELSQLCKVTQKSLTQAIAQLQDTPGVSQGPNSRPAPEKADAVKPSEVASTVEALQRLEALLSASDFDALQLFSQLRGSWVCLPNDFENAMDEALQALDLDRAGDLCRDALLTLSERDGL